MGFAPRGGSAAWLLAAPVEPPLARSVLRLPRVSRVHSQLVHFPNPARAARRHRYVLPMGYLPFEGPQRAGIRQTERSALSRWRGFVIMFRWLPEVRV